jgi:ribosomal protein L11 methyltransferase
VIDPAQAFGTGAHATTRLCLELLLELAAAEDARGTVLDVGAGSGVLAIAAVKLGYGPVLALDSDRESVRAILANAAVNGVAVDARRFDLRREELPGLVWDGDWDGVPTAFNGPAISDRPEHRTGETVVLANLLRPLLLELADTMRAPERGGQLHLIASGLLRDQADEVAIAFAKRLGLCERARRERGEWVALWLTRVPGARSPRASLP